jgi:hypothetical protein
MENNPMNDTAKTILIIMFVAVVLFFLFFSGGMATGAMMSGGMMGVGVMGGISWMWILARLPSASAFYSAGSSSEKRKIPD